MVVFESYVRMKFPTVGQVAIRINLDFDTLTENPKIYSE